jgi:hypothetical protein
MKKDFDSISVRLQASNSLRCLESSAVVVPLDYNRQATYANRSLDDNQSQCSVHENDLDNISPHDSLDSPDASVENANCHNNWCDGMDVNPCCLIECQRGDVNHLQAVS